MAVIALYRHGMTAGVPPTVNNHPRALRGEVGGWSEGATRRNTRFLYSIDETKLADVGFAVTLTLRDCPPDSAAWHRLRRAWEARLRRNGITLMHWVTEWQRRGVPHLHCAVFWPRDLVQRVGAQNVKDSMLNDWVMLAGQKYRAGFRGQDAHEITGVVGWFQYVSKHAARGVRHYQRAAENIPEGWKKTGRMWGKIGDWPTVEQIKIEIGQRHEGWFAYRRLVRSWRVADARASGSTLRLRSARRMLTCHDRSLSEVRGVSDWISERITLAMLANLAGRGFVVRC